MTRRFPPPWTARQNEESYSVHDATGFPICYLYFRIQETGGYEQNRLSRDEARRIATNIARLPELLSRG